MSMTPAQKTLVQTTFAQVADADALASLFYDILFSIDPSTKPLFHGDMAEQRKKLIATLAIVVHGLNDLSPIVPAIENLARRHVTYGVTVDHWASVGSALLWALKDTFGEAYTPDIHDAWAEAYRLVATTAINAAYPRPEELAS